MVENLSSAEARGRDSLATGQERGTILVRMKVAPRRLPDNPPAPASPALFGETTQNPTASSTRFHGFLGMRVRSRARRPAQVDSSTTLTLVTMDSSVLDAFCSFFSHSQEFAREVVNVFNQTNLSKDTVYRISILLLGLRLVHNQLLVPLEEDSRQLSTHLLWLLPLLTSILSVSISITLLLQYNPAETAVLAGVVTLLFVEFLMPLAVVGCAALFLVQALSLDSAVVMLATAWITCSISSRSIRIALYPSLGHG